MSLKAFHILFVAASILLSFGFGAWSFTRYADAREPVMLVFGIFAVLTGVALVFYGRYVLKKLKKISYL